MSPRGRAIVGLCALLGGCEILLEADPASMDAAVLDAGSPAADLPDRAPIPDAMTCVPVPPLVRFEDVAVGDLAAAAVPLGCGQGLRVRHVALVDVSPPDAFHLPDPVDAGPIEALRLTYRPRLVAERATAVLVLSTEAGEYTVPGAGTSRWTDAACRHWTVEALGTGIDGVIRLDATPPAGVAPTAAQVQWTVSERPEGSGSSLTEDFLPESPGRGPPTIPPRPAPGSSWMSRGCTRLTAP
ncbi:MAG: hypothetical protein R3F60_08780 [bacterium]